MTAPASVDAYLAALPADRRTALSRVREVIRQNLPKGYEEGIQYGMIGYYVPRSLYPAGYHANPKEPLPFVALGAQKGHMSLHLMCVYGDEELRRWFADEYAKTGKKLDMGKACVRFKKLEDLALDVVGTVIAKVPVATYVARYEAAIPAATKAKRANGVKRATSAKSERSAKKRA